MIEKGLVKYRYFVFVRAGAEEGAKFVNVYIPYRLFLIGETWQGMNLFVFFVQGRRVGEGGRRRLIQFIYLMFSLILIISIFHFDCVF